MPILDLSFVRANSSGQVQATSTPPIPATDSFRVDNTYLDTLKGEAKARIREVALRDITHSGKCDNAVAKALECHRNSTTAFDEVVRTRPRGAWFDGWRCIGTTAYAAIAFAMIIGELPLNMVVFEYARLNKYQALGFALIIGLGLWMFAHVTGYFLKRYKRSFGEWLGYLLVLAIIIFMLSWLAVIRQHYLQQMGRATGEEAMLTYAFLIIQALMLGGSAIASYAYHEPATRGAIRSSRNRYIAAMVAKGKHTKASYWESQAWRMAANRRRDVYISSNLENRSDEDRPPLVFYLADFGEEQVTRTPRELTT